MSEMKALVFIIFIAILDFISPVSTLKCFECNSVDDPGCENLGNNSAAAKYLTECKSSIFRPFCRKTTVQILSTGTVRVDRVCGWELFTKKKGLDCYRADTDFKYEISCQCFSETCNRATSSQKTTTLLLNLIIIIINIFNCLKL